LVALVALVVDISALHFVPPTADRGETPHWWPLVQNVAHGRGYVACLPEYFPFCGPTNEVTAQREPLPVLLFAAMARLTGDSLAAAAAVEVAVNLATLCGAFLLARELAGVRAGLLAALAWAAYLPAIQLLPQVSGDLPATLAVTCGLYCFLRAQRTGRAADWLLTGAWLGVGALSRSAVLVVAPTLAVGLVSRYLLVM
jgi:4-amino-4-deoxy-L-arabinose transferase-like glycosyltransferase